MAECRPYHVFINHRGPDTKRTVASLIYHALCRCGLRVFLDKNELQVGDSITPAIESAISSASVQIALFSEAYVQSPWCLDELVLMLRSQSDSASKIIPIFYDIEPSQLRHVGKGTFEEQEKKGRVDGERVDSWINALQEVSKISGVEFRSKIDDHGEIVDKILENVLKEVRMEELDLCDDPVGLREAAEHFEKEVLSPSEIKGVHVVGIVGLVGSGKSTLVTYLYNSKHSQFDRSCFLPDISKTDLTSLQLTLLRSLRRDQNLCIKPGTGKNSLRAHLKGLKRVLIVFDGVDNTCQIENLLFVKEVLGDGSLILVTSRDRDLLDGCQITIYNVKLLNEKHAQELFCRHAFPDTKPMDDLQDMVEELVRMCSGLPLALKILAGRLKKKRNPSEWKTNLEDLRIIMDSYKSLDDTQREAFLNVAHFFVGEDEDLVERVLDGLWDDKVRQCLQMLRDKCLVEYKSADTSCRRIIEDENGWSIDGWRGAKRSFKIGMHDLVRDFARQFRRDELPLRLSTNKMPSKQKQKFDLNGWFMPIFHRVSKGQLSYQIASLLWKGTPLEEPMGSRRFASMILKLFLTREVIVIMAAQGWQFWGLANIYSGICHGQLWRIFFGMYGFLKPAYPSRNALIISTKFAAELAFVHLLFPTIPLSVPVCDTLVGFLWSYAPQYVVRRRNMALMMGTNESSSTGQLVWFCHSCTSENGVFLDVCDSCGTPRESFAYDSSVTDDSQSSLINGTPNRQLITDLVCICRSCTSENGVFIDVCDNCGTAKGVIGYNDPVMEILQSPLISRRPNPEIHSISLVWNCKSCSFNNGVFFNACESCQTPHPTPE